MYSSFIYKTLNILLLLFVKVFLTRTDQKTRTKIKYLIKNKEFMIKKHIKNPN